MYSFIPDWILNRVATMFVQTAKIYISSKLGCDVYVQF